MPLPLLLAPLLAPWTLIYGTCLALWHGVSQAFWAAWIYPSFGLFPLKLLLTLRTLICDICPALWVGVPQAFRAAWTRPLFESFLPKLLAPWTLISDIRLALWDGVSQAFRAWTLVPSVLRAPGRCLLHCLGFRRRDVLRGSYAAIYQAMRYGGRGLKGSIFALFQSWGAKNGSGQEDRTVGTAESSSRN